MNQDTIKNIQLRYIIITKNNKVEKKCTLFPLRKRPDFTFRTKGEKGEIPRNSILLFPEGEPFSKELIADIRKIELGKNSVLNIVLIDSRWKKARGIAVSLPEMRWVKFEGYITGARRKDHPPEGGLASVEALYLASLHIGNPDPTLLSNYHFVGRFFDLNGLNKKL